jgi:hypothetical protein
MNRTRPNGGKFRVVPIKHIWQFITTIISCRVVGTSIHLIFKFFSQQLLYPGATLSAFPVFFKRFQSHPSVDWASHQSFGMASSQNPIFPLGLTMLRTILTLIVHIR